MKVAAADCALAAAAEALDILKLGGMAALATGALGSCRCGACGVAEQFVLASAGDGCECVWVVIVLSGVVVSVDSGWDVVGWLLLSRRSG